MRDYCRVLSISHIGNSRDNQEDNDNFDLNFNKNNLECSTPEPYAIYHKGFTVYSAGPL